MMYVSLSKDLKNPNIYKKISYRTKCRIFYETQDYQSQSGEEQKTVGALVLHP